MSEWIIRPMTEQDVPAVAALEKRCFPDAWSETSVLGSLSSPVGYLTVAEEAAAESPAAGEETEKAAPVLRGYLIGAVFEGEGELLRVAADPDMRRCGIGEALLRQMLEDNADAGIWRLDVRTQNAPAIALYRRFGFRILTENKDVYTEPKDNGYLMIRSDAE